MIKYILGFLLIFGSLNADTLVDELRHLSQQQYSKLLRTFYKASRYDVQWTMTAIMWQESHFGVNKVSLSGQDCGDFQINLKSFTRRYDDKFGDLEVSDKAICAMLQIDDELNFIAALEEIRFWLNVHGRDWRKVWGSYNAGFSYNSESGKKYANDIARRIKALKEFMDERTTSKKISRY